MHRRPSSNIGGTSGPAPPVRGAYMRRCVQWQQLLSVTDSTRLHGRRQLLTYDRNVNYTFQLRENYRYSNCGRDIIVCGGNAPCDLEERETKPPTAADSQPVCSTPASSSSSSSSSSSRVFLKWPKQQRHHEDHYIIITCREVYIRVLTVGHGDSFARTVRELVAFSASR